MELHELLKERFVRAIHKSFRPCPLIGDKWFVSPSGGQPGSFQFLGCNKLAKAMGQNARFIAQTIVKNLYITDIKADIEITQDARINLRVQQPPAGNHEPPSSD